MREQPPHGPANPQDPSDAELLLDGLRIKLFRIVLGVAFVSLGLISIRAVLMGHPAPWPDYVALASIAGTLVLLRLRPGWHTMLSWFILALLYLDAADGLFPWHPETITPTHLLLPLLVIYGTVLGNLRMSVVSAIVSLGIYAATALHYRPLGDRDTLLLTNLVISIFGSAFLSAAVWHFHRILIREVRVRNHQLQQQLSEKQQLQAILFHDIANPLTGLRGTVSMMQSRPPTSADLKRLDQMIDRMSSIIAFVKLLTRGPSREIHREPVFIAWAVSVLQDIFAERLGDKELRLETELPENLAVNTHADILTHSVLANLVSNAIKFSPRGSVLRIRALSETGRVRIQIWNPGTEIPEDVLQNLEEGGDYRSCPGTEGEMGLGHGLRIVKATLQQLQGRLILSNQPDGVCTEVDLPGIELQVSG